MRWGPLGHRPRRETVSDAGPTEVIPAVAAPLERLALPPSDRCLFVIGAARSGTTVLQNALNDSPDIFLFGEPDFHAQAPEPGFARHYNAMHRSWANQETKSTFCPAILYVDGGWNDYLVGLGAHHRYVGAKIVINPVRERGLLEALFDFHCRNFYRARYLFTFRSPIPTVTSTRDLQLLVSGRNDEIRDILRSYAETVGLYIRMLRNLPHVRAVFHDHVDRTLFDDLADWLQVPLDNAHRYYDATKVRDYGDGESLGFADTLGALERIYRELRQEAGRESRVLQAEQNNNHLSETHFSTIGGIDREARAIVAALSA